MRKCPACGSAMDARPVFGVEIDICPACAGVFLDPGEAEVQGIDTGALFGGAKGSAAAAGPTNRRCPAHRAEMIRYRISGSQGQPVDIDRATCCGGVFLDAGEQSAFARAAQRAAMIEGRDVPSASPAAGGTASVTSATGAVFAMPSGGGDAAEAGQRAFTALCRGVVARGSGVDESPPEDAPRALAPTHATDRRCPRCGGAYRADRSDGVEVDVCDGCGSMFFDPGETEAKGVSTAALFGVGPDAAQDGGVSALSCPACAKPMQVARVTTLAGILEVDRATCCGGLFLDGGEYDPLVRAARVAEWSDADQKFVRDGEVVGEAEMTRALGSSDALPRATAAFIRGTVDSMLMRMLRRRMRGHVGGRMY